MPDSRAKEYSSKKYAIFFADLAFTIAFLSAYQLLVSGNIAGFLGSYAANFYFQLALYFLLFSVVYYIFSFPISFYASYIMEHKYNVSSETLSSWRKDEVKKSLISFVVSLFLVLTFYLLLRRSGPFWWIWASAAWLAFNLILARILPTVIIPIFYKYSELKDNILKGRIMTLAAKAGIKVINVCEIDFSRKTKKANAAVVGMGRTRRVVLADNLINKFSSEEVLAVAAHEFGHHKLKHMARLILFFGMISAAGFFLLDLIAKKIIYAFGAQFLHDLRIFPAVMLILFLLSVLIKPVQNAYSRALETEADKFAIQVTGDAASFIKAMERLSLMNLADENPPRLIKYMLYDHPPISERVGMAREFLKKYPEAS